MRWIALVAAAGLLCWLLLGEGGASTPEAVGPGGSADRGTGDALDGASEAERLATLQGMARRRAVPGMHTGARGVGVLTGRVARHVPGASPLPLAGVRVEGLGLDGETPVRFQVETDADGRFEKRDAPALFGYELTISAPSYGQKRLQGISVPADQVTDVGTILMGLSTTLSGQVRTAEGGPPPGGVVEVLVDRSRPDSFDLRRGLFELQSAVDALAQVPIGSDGSFDVEDLPPGRYLLRVRAPGYATHFRPGVVITVAERSTAPRIVLDRGTGFEGVVRDELGRGIPGAHVLAVAVPGQRATRVDREDVQADDQGRYRLDALTPGVRYFLEAWGDGFAPTGQFQMTEATPRTLDITLRASGRVEGRITDEATGEGIVGAQVTIVAGLFTRLSPVSTLTDDHGRYVLPHVNAGPVILFSATAPGFQQADELQMGGVRNLRIEAGETTVVDMPLRAGGRVEGTVQDTEGVPVPGATVGLVDRRRRWMGERSAVTGSDGRYVLEGLGPATYDLRVTAAGFAPVTEDAEARVELKDPKAPVVRDLTLVRGGVVTGRVLSPEQTPVPGAQVQVEAVGGGRAAERVRDLIAISDAAGIYRIHGLPPGVPVVLVAEHDAWVRGRSAEVRATAGQELPVDLRLRVGATLPGVVLDERGRPVEGARVRWGNVDGVPERRLRDAFRADEYLGTRVLRTDAQGAFVIPTLEPGHILLKVEKEGHAPHYRRDLHVTSEGEQPSQEIELTGALVLAGRVLSESSRVPVSDCIVYAREEGQAQDGPQDPGRVRNLVSAQTDARGAFRLEGLAPGRYEVVLWFAPGFVSAAQDWRAEGVRLRQMDAGREDLLFEARRPAPPEDEDTPR